MSDTCEMREKKQQQQTSIDKNGVHASLRNIHNRKKNFLSK